MAANNTQAPMALRVNLQRCSRADYQALLDEAGIEAVVGVGQAGLVLTRGVPVDQLPQFAQGWVSVQDSAAQMAAPLRSPRRQDRASAGVRIRVTAHRHGGAGD